MAEKDVSLARDIQQDLLPHDFVTTEYFDVHGFSFAQKGVGGDYFDYRKFSDKKFGLIISDVAGKGVPAALVMVMIRSIFRVFGEENIPTDEVIKKINNLISGDVTQERYATFFYFIYDSDKKQIQYSNAANQPLLIYKAKEEDFIELDTEGPPLGITAKAEYEIKHHDVSEGDIMVLYTDGVTEAMNKNREQYGMERLKHIIKKNSKENCEIITKLIYDNIQIFTNETPQHDDMTLFISKIPISK